MPIEAEPFIEKADLAESKQCLDPQLPAEIYAGRIGRINITCVVSGKCPQHDVDRIGSQAAALLAWESAKLIRPDLIINAGTCGGLESKALKIGDVIGSHKHFAYNDRLMQPAKMFVNYGLGFFPAPDFSALYLTCGVIPGVISTGNCLELSAAQQQAMQQSEAIAKDMELASIAEVAMLTGTQLMGLKSVSDLIDHHESTPRQFAKHYKLAITNLTEKLMLVCRKLSE